MSSNGRKLPAGLVTAAALLAVAAPVMASTGGAAPGTPPPTGSKPKARTTPTRTSFPIRQPTWLTGFTLTEYWPVPERWFRGRKVRAPGVGSMHRIDFLYSARGVAMEGDGIALNGRQIHWTAGGSGWIDKQGRRGGYYWLGEMYWLNRRGEVTFPLESGGWDNGDCVRDRRHGNRCSRSRGQGPTRFGAGPSTGASGVGLRPLRSIAVDPRVISYRSAVYIPAYDTRSTDGWFCAADTGGAIKGRHIDVFRNAPATPSGGTSRRRQRVRVLPPATARRLMPFLCR